MNWPLVKIGDFCITGSGGTPSRAKSEYFEGDIPWIKSGDLRENIVMNATEFISKEAVKNSSAKMVAKGSILLAMYGATVGRMALLGIDATTNQAICNITPDSNIAFTKYVYYALLSKVPEFLKSAVGGAQPNISQGIIRETQIPLPPLAEQKRIAAILDKADAIRRKRQQAIKLADDFLRSVFLDMFGDPVSNPKGWPCLKLESLVSKPITYGILKPEEFVPNGIPMLRIQDLTQGIIDTASEFHLVSEKLSCQYKRTILEGGEIVISLVGSIGIVARVPYELHGANVHRNLGVIQLKDSSIAEYITSFMQLPQFMQILERVSKGGVHKLLNLADVKEIEIPMPTLDVIEKYTEIKLHLKGLVTKCESAKKELIFESLSQKAFSGQL